MSKNFGPYMIQTAKPTLISHAAVNDRTSSGRAREAAFDVWVAQISHMLDEWEAELIGHAAPLSTFETIAAFKDVLALRS